MTRFLIPLAFAVGAAAPALAQSTDAMMGDTQCSDFLAADDAQKIEIVAGVNQEIEAEAGTVAEVDNAPEMTEAEKEEREAEMLTEASNACDAHKGDSISEALKKVAKP